MIKPRRPKPVITLDTMPWQSDCCRYRVEHVTGETCWCQPEEVTPGLWRHFEEANN